jgi:hypothetical protein
LLKSPPKPGVDPSPSFFLLPVIYSTAFFQGRAHYPRTPHAISSACITQGDSVMKIIISALLALSVLAGIAAPGPYNPWTDDVGLLSPL